jgi:hypothetical protein
VLLTALVLTYFSRTTTDRQLAQSSYNDTATDLLARSALDIVVNDLKQEIINNPTVNRTNIQPTPYPTPIPTDNPNLIRYSSRNAVESKASTVSSSAASANGRSINLARWNSHYLIPLASTSTAIDSTPVSSFAAPDWVLVTPQGPNSAPAPNAVIGRYAFAVYDEGGLMDINVGGFPTYASLSLPRQRLPARHDSEESEILLVAGQAPNFTPPSQQARGTVGTSFSFLPNVNKNPTNFSLGSVALPAGISLNTTNGTIFGTPTRTGTYSVQLIASNAFGSNTGTISLTFEGAAAPVGPTPWPVNLARKGIVAFADLTTLPSTPTAVTPTTAASSMSGFLNSTQINKLMGWRNYATTQQTSPASFNSPSFPLASADNYAKYFLGNSNQNVPFTQAFTAVRNDLAPVNGRTDQAVMTRSELLKLQRTICTDPDTASYDDTKFPQSLLQYLGTFSREQNRPAPDWPRLNGQLDGRFDIRQFSEVIPDPVNTSRGKGRGLQKRAPIGKDFGLWWVDGITIDPVTLLPVPPTDPRYWGHWVYIGHLAAKGNPTNPVALAHIPSLRGPDPPDFFQILDYAMTRANGDSDDYDPNHIRNTFYVGAALLDQYDTDDLNDLAGNTITIIDYNGNTADWAYGIETMSFDDPTANPSRCATAPYPPPVPSSYVLLNRRFENVGEFGYAYNPASTTTSKTLDFFTSTSTLGPMLDFFSYNTASPRAGIINLNTRNGPVLASLIRGALLNDPGAENTPTVLVSQTDALNAAQAIVQETTGAGGPALTRADVTRVAEKAVAAVPAMAASDETRNMIARALAEVGQTRTWNLMIDVIAQTGRYLPGATELVDPNDKTQFVVEGEKRYWLHIGLDRDTGTVLGQQIEEVTE